MRRPAGRVPDQYHAFTARLAARGYQRATMRLVAGCILGLGLPALLAAPNPLATTGAHGRAILAVIALGCALLAVPWLRYRWPTRAESTTVVVIGTVMLAVGCTITSVPLVGLLIAVGFPFVLGYIALFHSVRLLAFSGIVTASTIALLSARVAVDDVPTAFAVVTPLVMLTVVVTFACRTVATVGGAEGLQTDVEPVTGLLTRESFYEEAATLLGARQRGDDRYLVVAVVGIDALSAIAEVSGGWVATQARIHAGQALRETLRRDAVLGHVGDSDFLIADIFTTADPEPLVERVRGSIFATATGSTASIGVVSTPLRPLSDRPPQEVLDEVIDMATTAMTQARHAGGNRARYVLDPALGRDTSG